MFVVVDEACDLAWEVLERAQGGRFCWDTKWPTEEDRMGCIIVIEVIKCLDHIVWHLVQVIVCRAAARKGHVKRSRDNSNVRIPRLDGVMKGPGIS